MSVHMRFHAALPATALFAAIVIVLNAVSFGQDSGVNLALHANSHASAADIGLPAYPGATLFKDTDNDSAADLGLTLGDFHFSLLAVNYVTSDSATQVLAFYRKPLSRYGEVLECDHGKPVGALTVTRSGLTCGNESMNDSANSSTDREIRAGSPHQYASWGSTSLTEDPPALVSSTLICQRTAAKKRSSVAGRNLERTRGNLGFREEDFR
jgi:hypothetical protein